ncbi:IS30 family transposase [Legionella geestiana]|uniref:IS30 family transposase n=1 Tax=Legionella geestiana TaxID=45065 RepID=UPI000E0F41FB|nr:IS30 family transposase [Legionella geestiana]QBS12827.1 IS30 family transposase [Legionella geestiana]
MHPDETNLPHPAQSITFDNGKEFAEHIAMAADLNTMCYFATPCHSWERGLNEHANGLIRQYLPKSTNLRMVTDEQIQEIQDRLNNRPRKVLKYRTPNEVFFAGISSGFTVALHC